MPAATALERLADLGLELPARFAPIGAYVPVVREGGFAFTSGAGPVRPDGSVVTGKVGADLDLDEAVEAARVVDGCSELFVAVFGEAGRSARSAVGVAELPMGIAVEIEAVVAC